MRTTINLDDAVFELAQRYAESRSLSLGRAVSELVRRGIGAKTPVRAVNGVQVFDLPEDSPRVGSKKVKELETEIE